MTIEKLLSDLIIYAEREAAEDEKIARLKAKAEAVGAIRYDKDKVKTTPTHDRMEQDAIKLVEEKERISKKRRKRFENRIMATAMCSKNLEPNEAYIMILFYVLGMSVDEIEWRTGYKKTRIYELRNMGLDKLRKLV